MMNFGQVILFNWHGKDFLPVIQPYKKMLNRSQKF